MSFKEACFFGIILVSIVFAATSGQNPDSIEKLENLPNRASALPQIDNVQLRTDSVDQREQLPQAHSWSAPFWAAINRVGRMLGMSWNGVKGVATDGVERVQLEAFKMFMRLYNRTYSPTEIPRRLKIFLEKRQMIQESIKDYMSGRSSFVMGENEFMDWDENELKALTGVTPPKHLNDLEPEERENESTPLDREGGSDQGGRNGKRNIVASRLGNWTETNLRVGKKVAMPTSVNWVDSGCVAKPMDQGDCGACYAIATVNVLESMRCIKGDESPILSSQQVVDCAGGSWGNEGCNGGWPTRVLKYLQSANSISKESCYPYKHQKQFCSANRVGGACLVRASTSDDKKLNYRVLRTENDIQYHVANTGPVVSVIQTTQRFLSYYNGVFDDARCRGGPDDVDHAISIVGYGNDNGRKYWLIKNSWGESWGIRGFGKVARGKYACSIGRWGWAITS